MLARQAGRQAGLGSFQKFHWILLFFYDAQILEGKYHGKRIERLRLLFGSLLAEHAYDDLIAG